MVTDNHQIDFGILFSVELGENDMRRGYFWFLVLVLASFVMMLTPSNAIAQKFCVNGKCYNIRQTSGYSNPMAYRSTSNCTNGQCTNGQCANGRCVNGRCVNGQCVSNATVVQSIKSVPSEFVEMRQITQTPNSKIVDGNSIPKETLVKNKPTISLLNI